MNATCATVSVSRILLVADRRVQILTLYVTRNDHLPTPLRRSHTTPGFNHDAVSRETCPDCLTNGFVSFDCANCTGRGYVEVHRQRDPYAVDHVQPYGLAEQAADVARWRDREIDVMQAQTAEPRRTEAELVADANQHPYAWELARRRMYERFDYAALDRLLEALRAHDIAPLSVRGLALLDRLLPDPLRAPDPVKEPLNVAARGRQADPRARAQRDDQVLELLAAGRSFSEIATLVGLSAKQLRRIANRDEEAA